jgi:hypothetical protein
MTEETQAMAEWGSSVWGELRTQSTFKSGVGR